MQNLKKMITIGAIISIGALFYVNFFVDGFIITLSIVLLPLLLYKYKDLNPILTCMVTAVASPLFRSIVMLLNIQNLNKVIIMVSPDIVFYIAYGFLFYFFCHKNRKDLTKFAIGIFMSDFLANLSEVSVRTKIIGLEGKVVKGLILIATVRCVLVLIIIVLLKRYKSFLIKQEHEERYKKLMLLISNFKSEIYFMRKNMDNIENVTKKTFKSYKYACENSSKVKLQAMLLDISKDIHEIKKDYIRVISGLELLFGDKFEKQKIYLKDMINILVINTKEFLEAENLNVDLNVSIKCDIYIEDHYYLMSIFRNLINNAIESSIEDEHPRINLDISEIDDTVLFNVYNNGKYIKEDDMNYIFNPGYSTKFNEKTGDINRGIGLAIVRDLVYEHFKGDIKVESSLYNGTKFTVTIRKEILEGDTNEDIYS
ncbi:HAMP domain-containing sensor histidine kinase [Clostridiaceae bacterium M8S5]|nr:HAMP domain-containing sensor histidine kinase [Clostridiaceae bacterium M8S5]